MSFGCLLSPLGELTLYLGCWVISLLIWRPLKKGEKIGARLDFQFFF
jgi:hypothetical protein